MVVFSLALRLLLGSQENKTSCFSLSWCPGGELVVEVGPAVGFLGAGVVRYVFALDMFLVTCEL